MARVGEIDVEKMKVILDGNDEIACVGPLHLYGFPCKMNEIPRLVELHSS